MRNITATLYNVTLQLKAENKESNASIKARAYQEFSMQAVNATSPLFGRKIDQDKITLNEIVSV